MVDITAINRALNPTSKKANHLKSSCMRERRRYPRVDKNLPIKLASGELYVVTETINISGNGAYCMVDKPLELMTKLDIVLLIPPMDARRNKVKKVHCKGVVVRSETNKTNGKYSHFIGIFFHDIKDRDRKTLVSYINTFLKSPRKRDFRAH